MEALPAIFSWWHWGNNDEEISGAKFMVFYSPGQTDSQAVANGCKLILCRGLLCRMPKRPASFLTSTRKPQKKKKDFKADVPCISSARKRLMDFNQPALTWVGWPNDIKLTSARMQIWSRPKWAPVTASHRKSAQVHAWPGQKESKVHPGVSILPSPFRRELKSKRPLNSFRVQYEVGAHHKKTNYWSVDPHFTNPGWLCNVSSSVA